MAWLLLALTSVLLFGWAHFSVGLVQEVKMNREVLSSAALTAAAQELEFKFKETAALLGPEFSELSALEQYRFRAWLPQTSGGFQDVGATGDFVIQAPVTQSYLFGQYQEVEILGFSSKTRTTLNTSLWIESIERDIQVQLGLLFQKWKRRFGTNYQSAWPTTPNGAVALPSLVSPANASPSNCVGVRVYQGIPHGCEDLYFLKNSPTHFFNHQGQLYFSVNTPWKALDGATRTVFYRIEYSGNP